MATASNTCNGSYGSDCKIYLDYIINNSGADRIARNKSNITLTLYAQATSSSVGAYNFNHNSKAYIYINNTVKKSATNLDMDFRNKKKVKMISWTGDVDHNADGTLAITIKGNFDTNGPSSITTGTVSYKWTLPTIPRTSSVTCADGNIGSATTININRASSGFKHTLTYSFQGLTGTIATKTGEVSIGWTIPTSFYSKIPNSKSGQGTITCQTYSGETLIGTKTCTFNAFVINSNPSITATVVDTYSGSIAATGDSSKLIKYISNAQVTISATAKNSATISSIKVVNGSKSATGSTTFSAVDSGTFNLSCTDSRGLSASNTVTKTIVDYITPAIVSAVFARASTTSDVVNATISGKAFNGSFGAKTNTFSLQWRYKESTASSYGDWITLTATRSGNNFSFSGQVGTGFDFQKEYNIEVRVSDYFKSNSFTMTLTRGLPIIDIGKNDININGNIYRKGNPISINCEKTINLSSLDQNTYYPVIGKGIPNDGGMHHLKLAVQLNSGTKPSWSTHSSGFTANLDVLQQAINWGTTTGDTIVLEYSYSFASSQPVSYQQLGNSSKPIFWCRGGGQYYIFTDYEETWTIYTSTVTFSSQSVSPSSTLPALDVHRSTIYGNLNGAITNEAYMNHRKIMAYKTLYDNANGSNGTITLNESIENYNFIRIYYRNNDYWYGSVDIAAPRGKKIELLSFTDTTTVVYLKTSYYVAQGSTLTYQSGNEIKLGSSSPTHATANNNYIRKLIGYL